MDIPKIEAIHDPSDIADYAVDFSELIAPFDIASVAVTVDSVAGTAGVTVGTGTRAPTFNNGIARFWVEVTSPSNPAFVLGLEAIFTLLVTTNSNPVRTFERSVRLFVRQSDKPPLDALAPITLAEAKAHLRVAQADVDDDEYIVGLINVAAVTLERMTGHVMRARNVTFAYDGWHYNGSNRIPLWRGPVNSVGSVVYDDQAGAPQTLAANQYRVREFALQPYIVPATAVTWPEAEPVLGAVRVTYNAGYLSNADVPEPFKLAAKLLIGHWFENREVTLVGSISKALEFTVNTLIDSYRLKVMA